MNLALCSVGSRGWLSVQDLQGVVLTEPSCLEVSTAGELASPHPLQTQTPGLSRVEMP